MRARKAANGSLRIEDVDLPRRRDRCERRRSCGHAVGATASSGTARSLRQSERRRDLSAGARPSCAREACCLACACTRHQLEATPLGVERRAHLSGTCRHRRVAGGRRTARVAGRGRRRADRIHRSPPGPAAATSRPRCRRFRRQARRRPVRLPARRRRRRCVAGDHRRRPRRRSARLDAAADLAAAISSDCRRRLICIIRSRSTGRARSCPSRPARRRCPTIRCRR